MAKKADKKNEFFVDIKAGLLSAIEHAEGKRLDLRTTTLPRPPLASCQNREPKRLGSYI